MRYVRALLCALGVAVSFSTVQGQQQAGSQVPTFQVTSRLVFLDVTVLDKKGRPVVRGLTKDDFRITEDKRPQRIFSFEAPDVHQIDARGDNPEGKAPVTILVLDLLNSSFQDFAYIRYEVQRYLQGEPKLLRSPAELMLVGNDSLEMVQGYTRSREDLLSALQHIPPILPYKEMSASFWPERFQQSIDALQQIALENKGVPGRKNIIWVGHGGPGIFTAAFPGNIADELKQYVHATANLLVDARVSLFVLYPGISVRPRSYVSAFDAEVDLGDDDPFAGDINFGVFVNETGGELFHLNDVDREIRESERLGSEYYTLTYQPEGGRDDGRFRRIRVTLRDPNLHALTKVGYFAPDAKERVDPWQRTMTQLAEAAQSTIPFSALNLTVADVLRHPDAQSAELKLRLQGKDLGWVRGDDGVSRARLIVAATSLSPDRKILASRVQRVKFSTADQDPGTRDGAYAPFDLTIRVPRKTRSVRIVVETETGGRMGTAEVSRKVIDAAPAIATPEPRLMPGPHSSTSR